MREKIATMKVCNLVILSIYASMREVVGQDLNLDLIFNWQTGQ